MESAMANVDLGRYRRIVQMFWDPEPVNDAQLDRPVWCLGCSYKLTEPAMAKVSAKGQGEGIGSESMTMSSVTATTTTDQSSQPQPTQVALHQSTTPNPSEAPEQVSQDVKSTTDASGSRSTQPMTQAAEAAKTTQDRPANAPETPPDSVASSFSSSLAYDEPGSENSWPAAFLNDFESRIWMTYRSEFEPITRSNDPKAQSALSLSMRIKSQLVDQAGFASDSGWGCMIRSGQSLLANAISILRLGRDWRRGQLPEEERKILSLFADDPKAPYSIHNFVKHGATACGKYPGEWFGPSATARCIQALANATEPSLRVYSTGDGPDVYEDKFLEIAQPNGAEFHPTLILVGTRLGIDKITPVYWEALIASLQMSQSMGIAGGRPSSSHYFVGAQGDFLFYLDPHHTRKALPYRDNMAEYTDEEIDSCHTARLRRVHVREMDPSMLIGFLIRSKEDWIDWRRCVKHVQGKAIISVADRDPMRQGIVEGREGAIDEVETLSDDDGDTILEA